MIHSSLFFMETEWGANLSTVLLLGLLSCYLAWSVLRDYRLVQHWEYKIWDMRRGHDRKGIEYEIDRMKAENDRLDDIADNEYDRMKLAAEMEMKEAELVTKAIDTSRIAQAGGAAGESRTDN